MTRLSATDLAAFARTYRFAGGRVRRVRVTFAGPDAAAVEVVLRARTAVRDLGGEPRPVLLRLRVDGAEEYRFQKRPGKGGLVADARFGYFDGLFFVNLDAFPLSPGDVPGPHDFRASDAYVGGRSLSWEEIERKKN